MSIIIVKLMTLNSEIYKKELHKLDGKYNILEFRGKIKKLVKS